MEEKNRRKKEMKKEKRERNWTWRSLSRGLPRDIKRGREDEYFSLEIVEKGENGTCYFILSEQRDEM